MSKSYKLSFIVAIVALVIIVVIIAFTAFIFKIGRKDAPDESFTNGTNSEGSLYDSNTFESFAADCLQSHNKYRAKHKDTDSLKINYTLVNSADKYANVLAKDNKFDHSQGDYGESLWVLKLSSQRSTREKYNTLLCDRVVKGWYNERDLYDYGQHTTESGEPGNLKKVGHFTQLVWKGTTDVGCAKAINEENKKVYVVCHYQPRGNYGGLYKANVLPPK